MAWNCLDKRSFSSVAPYFSTSHSPLEQKTSLKWNSRARPWDSYLDRWRLGDFERSEAHVLPHLGLGVVAGHEDHLQRALAVAVQRVVELL